MMYCDVAAGDGRFHTVECPDDGSFCWRFDGGAWIVGPEAGLFVRLAVSGVRLVAAGKGQLDPSATADGPLVVANNAGQFAVLHPRTFGVQCVGITAIGSDLFCVGAVVSPTEWRSWIITGDLQVVEARPVRLMGVGATSQGWLDFRDIDAPIETDAERSRAYGDGPNRHLITLWSQDGPWVIGQSNRPGDGIDAYHLPSQTWYRVSPSPSQAQPRIAVLPDGRAMAAVSFDSAEFIPSERFTTTWPEPKATVPDFAICEHVMAMAFADDPEEPEWASFCTMNRDDWRTPIDEARHLHRPVIGYWDGYTFNFEQFAEFREAASGVRCIPVAMCYPHIGESPADFRRRVEPTIARLARDYPDDAGVYGAAYRQWNGTTYPLALQQVLDCAWELYDLCTKYRVRVLLWFAWRRPWQKDQVVVDGVLKFAEFQEMARRLKAAVPTRFMFPKQPDKPKPAPAPEPVPVPTPEPQPDPWTQPIPPVTPEPPVVVPPPLEPPVEPKSGGKSSKPFVIANAVAFIGAAILGLFKWRKGK